MVKYKKANFPATATTTSTLRTSTLGSLATRRSKVQKKKKKKKKKLKQTTTTTTTQATTPSRTSVFSSGNISFISKLKAAKKNKKAALQIVKHRQPQITAKRKTLKKAAEEGSVEHSARYITYSHHGNHFLVSYLLIFLLPVLDLIVLLPSEMELPPVEYWAACGLALLHSLCTVVSFGDIYQEEAYVEKTMRVICKSARVMGGVALTEVLMLASQLFYLWLFWPTFQRNFYLSRQMIMWNEEELRLAGKLYRRFQMPPPRWNVDLHILFAFQAVRLAAIQTKIFFAASIRNETSRRNFAVAAKYLNGAKVGVNYQIPYSLTHLPFLQWFR